MDHSHYKNFVDEVRFVARQLAYYLRLNEQMNASPAIFAAVNADARFWLDYRYMLYHSQFITLGRIFDQDSGDFKVSNMQKMLAFVANGTHFSKESVRKRKIEGGISEEMLDAYMDGVNDWSPEDYRLVKKYSKESIALWQDGLKQIRDKLVAHNEIMDRAERDRIAKGTGTNKVQWLIQILVNIVNVLEQAELNGKKPDFHRIHVADIYYGRDCIDNVLATLVNGKIRSA